MRQLITIFLFISTIMATAQNGTAHTVKKTFSRTTIIQEVIQAEPGVIWELLTNTDNYSTWNSTIVSLTGNIQVGEKIQLVSTLAPERTFKLKVKEMVPNQKLVWGDALGKRTYTLEQQGATTLFTMTEKIGGPMFPLFAKQIPSFDDAFEQFTADLKRAAEGDS